MFTLRKMRQRVNVMNFGHAPASLAPVVDASLV